MKPALLHVLMHSFQLFEYNKETNPKLTIVSYPELESDYADFLKEFDKQPVPELSDTTTISDELRDDLQNYCEEVDRSRIFELISPDETESRLRRVRASRSRPSVWNTGLKIHRLKIGNVTAMVPMFPCFMGMNSDHFYITYGFNPGYMVIFKYHETDGRLRIFGLIEPTPVINRSFWGVRHLEKYFVQLHRTYQSKSRNMDPICSLTGYQQFRLCSLLENARRYDAVENDIVTVDRMINTERKHQKRCEENLKVMFEKLAKTNPAYSSLAVRITALPCHTDKNRFSFLVSVDPSDDQSVFILDWLVDQETGEKEGRVLQHVRDIALLKYANDFY